MRKLIVWNLVTLDGHFEGTKSWDLEFHNLVWGDELERMSIEQLDTAGMLLFGRTTYEGMAAYWTTEKGEVAERMNAIPKAVFSRTLGRAEWNNTRLVKTDAAAAVAGWKRDGGKDLFIFGSARLIASLMPRGLIDEYRLGMVPVVLGGGTPLFRPEAGRLDLRLLEARPLRSGCVILRYAPIPVSPP
jgi:dihydrofolate reductase